MNILVHFIYGILYSILCNDIICTYYLQYILSWYCMCLYFVQYTLYGYTPPYCCVCNSTSCILYAVQYMPCLDTVPPAVYTLWAPQWVVLRRQLCRRRAAATGRKATAPSTEPVGSRRPRQSTVAGCTNDWEKSIRNFQKTRKFSMPYPSNFCIIQLHS